MKAFTIISTVECLLKFFAVLILTIVPFDKLFCYGFFLFIVSLIIYVSYNIYSNKKYAVCKFRLVKNKEQYKSILNFSGWTFFGSMANVGMMQLNTILTDIFFGPIMCASRALSLQVNAAVGSFYNSFIIAVRPPMTKAYAEGNYYDLCGLFNISNRFIFYLLSLICIPLFVAMPDILYFWLGAEDETTVLFSRLIVFYSLIMAMQNPITIIMQAMGRVKEYFLPVESLTLLCVPITYIFYKAGSAPEVTFYVMICLSLIAHCVRLLCLKKYFTVFRFSMYFMDFLLRAILIFGATLFISEITYNNLKSTNLLPFIAIIVLTIVAALFLVTLVYLIGITKVERKNINMKILSILNK